MTLIYIMDPMCSWCYAFHPHLTYLISILKPDITLRYYMGGLAPDSQEPMPAEVQQAIEATWTQIEARTGTHFNHDFWRQCQPRRSTYPACRAVISAELMSKGQGIRMIAAIQQAYYQDARNPSDIETLTDLAGQLGIDPEQFNTQIRSEETEIALYEDLNFCRSIGVQGFPFLGLETDSGIKPITVGYCDSDKLLTRARMCGIINEALPSAAD